LLLPFFSKTKACSWCPPVKTRNTLDGSSHLILPLQGPSCGPKLDVYTQYSDTDSLLEGAPLVAHVSLIVL
jgi:hypothetical protein